MGQEAHGEGVAHPEKGWVRPFAAMLEHPAQRAWSLQTCADTLTSQGYPVSKATLHRFIADYCSPVAVTPKPALRDAHMGRRYPQLLRCPLSVAL